MSYNLFNATNYCRDSVDFLKFDTGTYVFTPDMTSQGVLCTSNHGSNGYKKIGFYIKEMQSFTIDGHGSEFLFDGTLNPFVVDKSENITLKNFAVNMTKTFYRDMPGRPLHKYGCLNLRGF